MQQDHLSAKSLNVVVTCDNHYIVLLAALIKSIETNLNKNYKVSLHIIEDRVSSGNKKKLERSINSNIITINWYRMKTILADKESLPIDGSSFPLNIYMRLFIPYFIPEGVDKVLYLDVDMIAETDISLLVETNMQNHIVAAVQDPRVLQFGHHWGGVPNYHVLGFKPNTPYFNTGLLLINIAAWRENNITAKVIDCINRNKKYAFYPDQYGLNVVLANQWLSLDSRWNFFSSEKESNQASAAIIHFIERKPIYRSYYFNDAFKEKFYQYLQQTEWKSFRPLGEIRRYYKKINNLVYKKQFQLTHS